MRWRKVSGVTLSVSQVALERNIMAAFCGTLSLERTTQQMVKVRVYIAGVLVGEEEVKGPLAVHKPAPVAKKQGKVAK